MALSNIGREPRREITEQLLGIVALAVVAFGWGYGSYASVIWLGAESKLDVIMWTVMMAMCGFPFIGMTLVGLTFLAHEIGEIVCDGLASAGFDPRPRQRY